MPLQHLVKHDPVHEPAQADAEQNARSAWPTGLVSLPPIRRYVRAGPARSPRTDYVAGAPNGVGVAGVMAASAASCASALSIAGGSLSDLLVRGPSNHEAT